MLIGKLQLHFINNEVKIVRVIFGITITTKTINLSEINEFQFIKNANDETFTSFGGIRVFDKIPYKMVIKTKSKNIAIGNGLVSFNIEALKEEFKKRKKAFSTEL